MQVDFEQAIEIIKTLPPEDFRRLDEWIEEQKRNDEQTQKVKKARSEYQIERYKKARKWLDEYSAEYMNQWVCLEGDRLIAHGADALEVHRIAVEQGIESPFLHHIVEEPTHYIGGW